MSNAITKLSADEVRRALNTPPLAPWSLKTHAICRRIKTRGWRETLALVNAIAERCDRANHHPELHIRFAEVEIELTTHDCAGVSVRDIDMASAIEKLLENNESVLA